MNLPPAFVSLIREFERVLASSSEVASSDVGKFIDVDFLADLTSQATSHIRSVVPDNLCPWCNAKGCQTCRRTGRVPRQIWLRAPAELRGTEDE